jgi:pimeloyl-ACP methyl ester carboxylesterase
MNEKRIGGLTTSRGMAYSRRGSGSTIVLLHGWCLNARLWMYAEEHLSGRFDVVIPDLAGFGQSHDLPGPYTFDRYRDDLAAMLEELHLEAVTLVGFAFGAAVAMKIAAAGNHRVARIINVGIPSASATPYERMPKSMRRDWPDFARRSAKALFHCPQSEATMLWVERMFVAAPLAVAIETVGELARLNAVQLANKIVIPQLFIHATEDAVAPIALGEECVTAAVNAVMEIVNGSGHLIVIDAKEAFHALLDTYLSRNSDVRTGRF